MTTQAEMVAISNAAADAASIPRLLLLACACAESSLNPMARRPASDADDSSYWPDVSGGAWQQTVRWDPEYRGGAGFPGAAEIERVLALQYDPVRSARVAAANLAPKWHQYQPDTFATLCAYNWPAGGGEPASAATAATYRRGISDAQRLLGASIVPTYNPDTPLILQNDPWSCWATSARMALESWGRHPTEGWIESQAIADNIESTSQGLLDASGKAGADWLTRQYSDPSEGTPTIRARNADPVSFDDVRSLAGATAILLGGRHWGPEGHWSFVRRYDPSTDQLVLGNPAGTWGGIGGTMSRQQFGQIAPCSMVVVTADGAVPVPVPTPVPTPVPPVPTPPPGPDPRDALIAQLKADLDDARSKLGVITVNYAQDLENVLKAIRALKPPA